MFRRLTQYAAVVLLFAALGPPLAACETESANFRSTYRGGNIGDFNDFGAIAIDSNNGGQWPTDCAKLAHDRLVEKLRATPDSYFQQSLAGYSVALIFAAAQRIASYGWFNTAWDPPDATYTLAWQLDRVMQVYREVGHAGDCGDGFGGNSCMDDYAGYAAAWGWISAYKKKRGDGDTWLTAQRTGERITWFFNNVCIHNPTRFDNDPSTGICNAPIGELGHPVNLGGPAEVFAYEHEMETPHYGFGLLTSIAQAIVGLEAAGAAYALSENEKTKARALMQDLQSHVQSDFTWKPNDCKKPLKYENGSYTGEFAAVSCADFGYDPRMYHLAEFFRAPTEGGHVGSPPSHAYQSDDSCCRDDSYAWDKNNYEGTNFGIGRFATYREQGYTWYRDRGDMWSARYMPFNLYEAKGWLDAVNDDGVAYGWACDPDAPTSWVKVDLYANGVKVPDTMEQYAWWDSIHWQVNEECGGGIAHRFYIQLPPWAYGAQITAAARDFTMGATIPLNCATECGW